MRAPVTDDVDRLGLEPREPPQRRRGGTAHRNGSTCVEQRRACCQEEVIRRRGGAQDPVGQPHPFASPYAPLEGLSVDAGGGGL